MGSHGIHGNTAVANLASRNNDDFEENIFNDLEEEGSSEMSLSNIDMDTSMIDSDYEDHDQLIPIEDNSSEVDINEDHGHDQLIHIEDNSSEIDINEDHGDDHLIPIEDNGSEVGINEDHGHDELLPVEDNGSEVGINEDHGHDELLPVEDNRHNGIVRLEHSNLDIDTTDSEDENIFHEMKKMKYDVDEAKSCDDSNKCPICLGAWNNSGKHRLCSLRCGHLFGYKCIKIWLDSNNNREKKCPQCLAKASLRHIRFLYANKLISLDNSEIERMKEELKQVRQRESKIRKALIKEKEKSRKYKQMYKTRTLALVADSDCCLSD